MPDVFISCAKTDCRWNKAGACNAAQIFVDNGVRCATYEPQGAQGPMAAPASQAAVMSPQASAMRQALLARMAGAMPGASAGPGPSIPRLGA